MNAGAPAGIETEFANGWQAACKKCAKSTAVKRKH